MKIGIIAGTAYPANEESYGSEHTTAILANELGKEHDVHLFAPPKSMKGRYKLHYLPCCWGQLDFNIESTILHHSSTLLDCDYIIDASPYCLFTEEVYFFNRDWLRDHVLVYYRNGTSSQNPRYPVNWRVPGVFLSETAIENLKPCPIPKSLTHVIPYGIPDWFKPKEDKEDYVLYLSACRPEKGLFEVLDIAKQMPEQRFVFAWTAASREHKNNEMLFFDKAKDLPNVEHREVPDLETKIRLFQNAKAYIQLNRPDYVEAFGLTSCEALACGTPVIREDSKAAREILSDEVSFFAKNQKDVVDAIENAGGISPKECSGWIKETYPVEKYAKRFLELYNQIKQ